MILPLEEQVCAKEYTQKLRELGVKQESLWYWYSKSGETYWLYDNDVDKTDLKEVYSAFTVAELGILLPYGTYSQRGDISSNPSETKLIWYCVYEKIIHFGDTEANVKAKMLIWWLENRDVKETKV